MMKLKISLACVCLALAGSAALAAPAVAAPTGGDRAAQTCGGGLSARIGVWEFQESRVAKAGTHGVEVGYGVTLQPGANAFITAEAKGYDAAGNETWYGLGTSSSTLRRMVPWGNSLAHPAIKILNNGPALAPPVQWTC
jgi:ABC-type sugar transport system substrate-binding protein